MKKLIYSILMSLLLTACGTESDDIDVEIDTSSLENTLSDNKVWPYELVGILDIIEAGGYEDSEYPNWAVGSLVTDSDAEGVGIDIGAGVVSRSKIDIDSGKKVNVWLEEPTSEDGYKVYPISRIEKH